MGFLRELVFRGSKSSGRTDDALNPFASTIFEDREGHTPLERFWQWLAGGVYIPTQYRTADRNGRGLCFLASVWALRWLDKKRGQAYRLSPDLPLRDGFRRWLDCFDQVLGT
jgi:hypothetical protein